MIRYLLILLAAAIACSSARAARAFDGATSYIIGASAPRNTTPVTMAAWFRAANLTTFMPILTQCQASGNNNSFRLELRGDVAGDKLNFLTLSGSSAFAESSASVSADIWHHACGISNSSSHRIVYLDGVAGSANTTNLSSPSAANRIGIGEWINGVSGGRSYFAGDIAEAAIWSAALTAEEVASLARGVSPLLVRPSALVFYAPLWREVADYRAGIALTDTGPTTAADHPRVYR